MKCNTNNFSYHKIVITSVLLASTFSTLAITGDTNQPIYVNSEQQSLDMKRNTVTFIGNVVVKQGTIEVNAEKVVISCLKGINRHKLIEAFGNPVTFYQMQDNKKPVQGHSKKVRYDLAQDKVTLTDNASLEQLDSNIKGDRITYLVKHQKMEAVSYKGRRVTFVLVEPPKLEKN